MRFTLGLLFLLLTTFSSANEKVTLQLKWFHQFQFAGYYAAKEKGFFEEVGLDVEIRERDLKYNNVQEVIDGKAQYGVADSILMLYKAKKEPVVMVTPIFQHSPSVLLTLKGQGTDTVYDLTGKDILFYPNDTDGFSLLALFKQLNINPNLIRKRERGDYKKLMQNRVSAMPAYLSNEPFFFQQEDIVYNIINPAHYGFDLYGDMLFASLDEAKNHPKRVEKFKKAVIKGWEYALEHKEEMIHLIQKKYNSQKSLEHLRFEATIIEQMIAKESLPIGTLDKGRIRYTFELYKQQGLLKSDTHPNDFIFEDFQTSFYHVQLSDEEKFYLEQHPILRVQNIQNFPPYNFRENGFAKGFIVDYMSLIAKILGIEIEFEPMKTWADSLEGLRNSQLDVIPQIAQNKEREVFIDFSNISHTKYTPAIVVRKDSNIRSLKDLKEKKLAVLNKSFLHTVLQKEYPQLNLYLTSTFKENLEAVSSGKVAAAIENFALAQFFIHEDWLNNIEVFKLSEMQPTELQMGVRKGNALLKSILEKADKQISKDEINKLRNKWMNSYASSVALTQTEIDFLLDKKEFNVCVQSNYLPFESVVENRHIGMTSEYIKLFQKELPVKIRTVVVNSYNQGLEYLKSKQCDFITLAEHSADSGNLLNYTSAYIDESFAIATKQNRPYIKSFDELSGKRVGIYEDKHHLELFEKRYPQVDFVLVKSIESGLKEVSTGQLYGVVDMFAILGYQIQKSHFNELKIAGKFEFDKKLSIASLESEDQINAILNKLLDSISQESKKKIERDWYSVKYQEQIDYTLVFLLVLFFVVVIALILYKNRTIRKINYEMEGYIKIVDENILTSATDLTGKIIYASKAFCEISGYKQEELLGKCHNIIRHPDMPKEVFEDLWQTIQNNETWQGELKNRKKDGGYYWVDASITPVFDEENKKVGYTAIRQDITDKKIIEEISITDGLTNIFNRRHFNEIFPKYINSAKRKEELLAFLIMDVDHFKQYNDTYGHQKGDDVLKSIAQVLQNSLQRAEDYCFRLGGEEFGVLFKTQSKQKALVFANQIRQSIEDTHIEHKGNSASAYVTASMGLYCDTAEVIDNMDQIFKKADDLLYKAKESGRNNVQIME